MNYKIEIKNDFIKECTKLPPKINNRVKEFVFITLANTANPLQHFEKMKGFKTYYKKRFGDYRLGVEINQSSKTVYVLTIMNRKDIYRYFPPI